MKNFFFLFLVLITSLSQAQNSSELSKFNYILLPTTFSFQNEPHQYNLNRLTKFLFNKYNFKAFIEDEGNIALQSVNPCQILRVNAFVRGVFKSKVKFTFIDCRGNLIYTSQEGVSSKKDFDKSYNEALRNIFKVDKKITGHIYNKDLNIEVIKPSEVIKPKNSISEGVKEKSAIEFELRGSTYSFISDSKTTYSIFQNSQKIGNAVQQANNKKEYNIDAGVLTGTGKFDDFGNFELKRINPANKKELVDIMVRTK